MRSLRVKLVGLVGLVVFFFITFFKKLGSNGRPGGREAPQSTSVDETRRIKSVWARWVFGTFFCKTKSARKTTKTCHTIPETSQKWGVHPFLLIVYN